MRRSATFSRQGIALLLGFVLAGCLSTPSSTPPSTTAVPTLVCGTPCALPIDAGVRWEPMVAVDPNDPQHIVVSSHDLMPEPTTRKLWHWAFVHVTFDGGITWTTSRLPGGPDAPPTHPLFGYNNLEDSVPAFLPDGTLLWSVLASDVVARQGVAGSVSSAALVVLRSSDGGRTFTEVTIVQGGEGTGLQYGGPMPGGFGVVPANHDKNWLTVAPDGTPVLTWTTIETYGPHFADSSARTVIASSHDGGRTWSPPATIYEGIASGAVPIVRRDGGWVVAYRETDSREVRVAVSTDDGATWDTTVVDASNKFPALAASTGPAGERLYLVYPDGDADSRDGPQVVTLRWSDDGGLTWSAGVALDAPVNDGRTIPAVAATSDGVVVTFWHLGDPGAELRAVRVRGDVVSEPIVLDGTEGSTAPLGDYMGVASGLDGSVFAVWISEHGGVSTVTGGRISLH